jgi:hypothetical protein
MPGPLAESQRSGRGEGRIRTAHTIARKGRRPRPPVLHESQHVWCVIVCLAAARPAVRAPSRLPVRPR